jgi:lysophospholipase L1-like esterase
VDAVTDIGIHLFGLVTNYTAAAGNAASLTGDAFVPVPPTADPKKPNTFPVYWVAGLDVASTFNTGTVVALGDSITDGRCSTRDANGVPADTSTSPTYPDEYLSWPDLLARRLLGFKAVVNQGIAGNEITGGAADSLGQPALVRVASDVLAQQGATHVIFLEGTNDIAANAPLTTTDVANEIARLEEADQRIIADAHLIGLNVIGATILPRGGEAGWTVQMDLVRVALNDWIRTPGVFDGVIDFDGMMLLAGAKNRGDGVFTLPKGYHCYDGVHPNADGYALMAAGIDLALFSTPLRPR